MATHEGQHGLKPTLTTQLLGPLGVLTKEIILGATGPRVIGGDFNVGPQELELFDYWRSLGWRSAQDYAEANWSQPKSFTCKHATERGLLWMSPEAVRLCQWIDVADLFSEHIIL